MFHSMLLQFQANEDRNYLKVHGGGERERGGKAKSTLYIKNITLTSM